jgi:hypothetical protein
MPEKFREFGEQWREQNPGWEVIDWTSWDQLEGMVGPLPPLTYKAKDYYPNDHKRFEADVLRLQILWRLGGVYVDTDVEPGRYPLDIFLRNNEDARVIVGRSPQHIDGHHPITNCVILAEDHADYIWACQDQQARDIQKYSHRGLAQSIGPWSMTRAYELPGEAAWQEVRVYNPGVLFDGTYFVHHWNTARRKKGKGLG